MSYFELLPVELNVHIEKFYKSAQKTQFAESIKTLIKYRKSLYSSTSRTLFVPERLRYQVARAGFIPPRIGHQIYKVLCDYIDLKQKSDSLQKSHYYYTKPTYDFKQIKIGKISHWLIGDKSNIKKWNNFKTIITESEKILDLCKSLLKYNGFQHPPLEWRRLYLSKRVLDNQIQYEILCQKWKLEEEWVQSHYVNYPPSPKQTYTPEQRKQAIHSLSRCNYSNSLFDSPIQTYNIY